MVLPCYGMYVRWSTFVKTISAALGNKKYWFASVQESTRKDVERAFRVLQQRFAIVRFPASSYMVDRPDGGDHECMCYHTQHDH